MKPVRWLGRLTLGLTLLAVALAQEDVDSEESRKVLGSSVVTSVSVIMDHGNGTKTYITDAAGQPVDQTEGAVGSPVDLLNPDRYEFYTFDETGDLVKRLMTLDQIKGLLAGGDSETLDTPANSPTFYHETLAGSHLDDSDLEPNMAQGVHSVVASVQNVLRSELANKKKPATSKPPLSIPDSISSWSMLFPPILSDSSEILDDGNSVSEPIDGGDRLPAASSNEEKVKKPEAVTEAVTSKPTAVPPIIHFLEIQSVPSPLKSPTKTPGSTSTTPVTNSVSTTKAPVTTTQKPTSPVNSIQEMSASISSLLSQVTDDKSSTDVLNTPEENKLSVASVPAPTTESVKKAQNVSDVKPSEKLTLTSESQLKPESSNVNTVTKTAESSNKKTETVSTKNKPQTTSTSNKVSKPSQTIKVDSNKKPNTETNVTKKNPDAVVSLITTSKPVTSSALKANPNSTKSKPSSSLPTSTTKQKIHTSTQTAPVLITKNNVKPQTTSQNTKAQLKKPVKPATPKPDLNVETLEALGSEGVIKVVPSKLATPVANKTKTNTQTKTNVNTSSPKPSTKPTKKVPNNKPATVEHVHTPDCEHSKVATSSASETKNKDKLETAASTTQSEKVKPSKVKPVQQEVRVVPKPSSAAQISKPAAATKVKPSEQVKITTYKPSTSQPFTTKHSKNKLSTTTERPLGEMKVASESKIHEVNSSLLDVVKYLNKNEKLTATKMPPTKQSTTMSLNNVNVTNYEVAASNTAETLTAVPAALVLEAKNAMNKSKLNDTDNHDHHSSDCTHSKPQSAALTQEKISDVNHDGAASNTEEVKVTTDSTESATEATTDNPSVNDVTTEPITEDTTIDFSTTPEVSEEKITDLPETTTLNMPEMDIVKEGISAVTNILLDENPNIEPQLMMAAMPLSESASNIDAVQSPPVKGELKHASSFDDMEMTTNDPTEESVTESTERELTDPTTISPTEIVPTTLESVNNSSKISDDTTEQVTEAETTPAMEETTTPVYEEVENKESSESKLVSIKQTLPTKESKLSPESNETILATEPTVICNHTLEQIKNSENITSAKDHLEPAQSAILEVNNSLEEKSTAEPTTLPPRTTTSSPNLDTKSALKQDPSQIKFTPVKYPSQNSFRPVQDAAVNPSAAVELHPAPHESMGLEATTAFLADDVRRFSDLCNELAFRMWTSITGKGSISSRSLVLSPFATTSLLAMVFLGARGPTSGQMNDVLRLDDMVTFNPHQVLQNVTESVLNSRNYGVTTAAFVRELYSDKLKGKILDFYKERAQQYYDGHVEEISFNVVNDILRRRTNLLVKRQTLGKIPEYLRGSNLSLRPPLAAFSANIFQTDCDLASTEGRDGEMYFVVRPSTRQRRLVPVPAAVWRTGFLAGYEPGLDATAVALGTDSVVSTILVLPGQQGQVAPGDGLARLEQRLIETSYRRGGWTRLLRSLLPRPGLELQVPRFSHRSVLNVSSTLQRMGLKDLFNENKADLRGLNGFSNDLHLSDVVQINTFSTCGEDTIGARHHIETYPVSPQRMGRDEPELYPRPEDLDDRDITRVPLNLRPRQARLPDNPRLRFDRPFIYLVRHNPTGMILYMGRFNPRLLP